MILSKFIRIKSPIWLFHFYKKLEVLVAKNRQNLKKISNINIYSLVPQIDHPVTLCIPRSLVATLKHKQIQIDLNITMKNICLFCSIKMIEHAFDVVLSFTYLHM